MKSNMSKWLFVVCLFAGMCASAVLAVPAAAQSGAHPPNGGITTPVQVVNTPNVNVANTPSVSVSNTPNVNVTNTPSVNVANSPSVTLEAGASVGVTSPLDGQGNPTPIAVLDAFQPYYDSCSFNFSGQGYGYCYFQTIPSDKQLVIQEFDAIGQLEPGLRPQYVVLDPISGSSHYFTATYMTTAFGADDLVTNAVTRLYATPGASPACSVALNGYSSANYFCQITGFLVDAPLPGSGAASPAKERQRPQLPGGRNSGPSRPLSNNSGH